MKFFFKTILFIVLVIAFMPDLSFPQYPLVTIEQIQYQHPDSLLLNGDRPSPYNGQTVKVRGVVMASPLVNPNTDRRPLMWAGARWVTYLNDPSGSVHPNFDGINVLQMDTSIQYQGTMFEHLDTAQVVEITLTVNEYLTTTQGESLLLPVTPVVIIQQLPKRPDPIELEISDFVSGGLLNPLAEEYEGQYVIIRNVMTSNRNDSSGTFQINDTSGNYIKMYDQSGYFTLRSHRLNGLTDYQPPNDSTPLSYIRGIIQTRSYGYFIAPIYPGDIKERQTFQLTVNVAGGWNMVSVPGLNSPDQNVNTWWAYRDPAANVFKYDGGYLPITIAATGRGYWMKHSGDRTYNTGDEWPASGIESVYHNPIPCNAGWNLIGIYEDVIPASGLTTVPQGLITGPVYGYAGGYYPSTYLQPGYGYWVKLTSGGQIIIPDALEKESEVVEWFDDWGKIIFKDAAGSSQTLYSVKGKINLDLYEMPPQPPADLFDVRFNSGRIAEDINSAIKTIEMSGVTYPLTVRVEGIDIRLMDETGKAINVNLKAGENVVISDATIQKLMVSSELLPTVYALEQNYPNPFNPITTIKFSLPEATDVALTIYNVLGEKVTDLVNSKLEAGRYSYQWAARDVASGIYIYELRTDKFVSVKKMILLK